MKKKIYKVKCPKHIVFGDSLYFEEYTGKKLASLVADYKLPPRLEARVLLEEKPMEEYPEYMDRTMTICVAPAQTVDVYADGKMFEGQEIVQKDIGVDTAEYIIHIDGRYERLHTWGDGYWGSCQELYRQHDDRKLLDALIITVGIPDSENFEDMQRMTGYLFENAREIWEGEKIGESEKGGKEKGQER